MVSPSLRRLAMDQASLRQSPLPPNYLFPLNQAVGILPDDLTQLTVLVTGSQGTPYAQGLWQLHLRIPTDYPKTPPKASFKTRIWHPNVEEDTGAVCLETLKRDWDPKLTLRDILITISCLLIHPNPDSALNSAAGSLLRDDYAAFEDQARLMTSIHGRIPAELRQAVNAARRRGEEDETSAQGEKNEPAVVCRKKQRAAPLATRKRLGLRRLPPLPWRSTLKQNKEPNLSENEEDEDPSKENDPSKCPDAVMPSLASPRTRVLGKRPLSELPLPVDPDHGMTQSEKNIAANGNISLSSSTATERAAKSPRLKQGQSSSIELLMSHAMGRQPCLIR